MPANTAERKVAIARLKAVASSMARKGAGDKAVALRGVSEAPGEAVCDLDLLIEVLNASTSVDLLAELSGRSPEDVSEKLARIEAENLAREEQAQERLARLEAEAAEKDERALMRAQPVPLVLAENEQLPPLELKPYSVAEISAAVVEQSRLAGWHHSFASFLPLMGLRVPTGDTIYAYSFLNRDYFQTSKDAFIKWIVAEARLWPREFFERFKEGKEGPVPKVADDYVTECTTMLECPENEGGPMLGRTDIQTSYFDPIRKQFVRAQSPLRRLLPQECPEFAEFLEIAVPDPEERTRLEDHMLAALDLSRPSAGVHITGPKRNAKSAFVEGISRLYGVKGSTPGELFYSSHNDWVNPIIHEEEKPAQDSRGEELTAAHRRNIITRQAHVINPKHVRQYVVKGYTRHFFTENGDRMFNFSGETEAEIRATSERIDSFSFTEAAAEWLEKKGGAAFVQPWITENLVARHILWLKQQREIVNKGSRMLVDGRLHKSVAMLQAQDRSAGRVLNCIARYVAYDAHVGDSPIKEAFRRNRHAHRAVLWGNGELAVNANRLMENWQDVMGQHDRPPTLEVVRVVIDRYAVNKESAVRKIDGKTCRVKLLNVESFLEYCEQYDIEDPTEMRAKIAAPEKVETSRAKFEVPRAEA